MKEDMNGLDAAAASAFLIALVRLFWLVITLWRVKLGAEEFVKRRVLVSLLSVAGFIGLGITFLTEAPGVHTHFCCCFYQVPFRRSRQGCGAGAGERVILMG
jgi:hypothetical protein